MRTFLWAFGLGLLLSACGGEKDDEGSDTLPKVTCGPQSEEWYLCTEEDRLYRCPVDEEAQMNDEMIDAVLVEDCAENGEVCDPIEDSCAPG